MIGRTISHYRVDSQIGAGGMGIVYKAEDLRLKRTVALKFVSQELTRDPDAKERLVHEAQAASALDHPNICTIHEIDEGPDGQLFVAMTHYEGETLRARIARGPLPIEEALDLAAQVARGVSAAHDAGIVHRDIKPANIMITRRGEAKLLDFGIAKLSNHTRITRTGTTLGTVAYMAPELIAGADADARSDVWAIGVVLFEMLSGRLPFDGTHEIALMNAIANARPHALRSLRSEVSPGLEAVVARLREKHRPGQFMAGALARVQRLGDEAGQRCAPHARLRADAEGVAPGSDCLLRLELGVAHGVVGTGPRLAPVGCRAARGRPLAWRGTAGRGCVHVRPSRYRAGADGERRLRLYLSR